MKTICGKNSVKKNMERHYPRDQSSNRFLFTDLASLTKLLIIDLNWMVINIFRNYSIRYMIRLKGIIIFFFRVIFSFHLARIRNSYIRRCGILAIIEDSHVVSSSDLYITCSPLYIFYDYSITFCISSIIFLSFSPSLSCASFRLVD